ncbi:MAG: ABC transporter permease [Candidatus Solibacter sp.]
MPSERLFQDLRYAIRGLRRTPGFAAVAVLTLALGIGANTAIFGIVEALLLRPLPFKEPDRLVSLNASQRGIGVANAGLSLPELEDFRDRAGIFDAVTPAWVFDTNLTGGVRPERVEALAVMPNYFDMLGARPQLGRLFGPQDTAAGFAEAAVLSDAAWRQRFGGDPHILGRSLRFDNDLYTVVGVLPPDFRNPGPTVLGEIEVWITAGFRAAPFPVPPVRNARMFPRTIARLKPGMSVTVAKAKLDAFADGIRRQYPDNYPPRVGWTPSIVPLAEDLTGNVRTTLLVVFGSVACVLLIACIGIANLLLARATARQREFAIRRAVGASHWMIVRQVLVESVALAALGGAAGLLLAAWLQPVLLKLAPVNLPRLEEVGLNWTILGFTAAVSLLTGTLFGLIPALQIARTSLLPNLKEAGKTGGMGSRKAGARAVLVICEIAFSMTLLLGAGLLLKSFWNVIRVNPGFNPRHVMLANLWLPVPNDPTLAPYRTPEKRRALVRDILRRVRALSGVELAAIGGGQSIPLLAINRTAFRVEGADATGNELPSAQFASVSPDFFRVLGTPLIAGRWFLESDEGQDRVALIDEALATRYWKNQSPLGKRIDMGRPGQPRWVTVVGVVGTIKTEGFDSPDAPHLYLSIYQGASNALSVFIRTNASATVTAGQLRREVQAVDVELPVFGVRPLEEVVSQSLARRRFALNLVGAFALIALALAALGIYGVTSFSVGQRAREIGLRMALGAANGQILFMILRQGMAFAIAGIAGGAAGAFLLTRFLQSLLFGTEPTDPFVFLSVAFLLAAVTTLACCIPARRAMRIDPAVTLRAD